MDRRIREQLPLFDELNATAADDEAFRLLWENGPSDLPGDSVFMASHRVDHDVPPHANDFFELSYVTNGRAKRVVGDDAYYLLPNSLCLVCPGTTHALLAVDQDAIMVNLCLRPQLFDSGVFLDLLNGDTPLSRAMRGDEGRGFVVFSDAYGRILTRSMIALIKEYDHAGRTASYAVKARVLLLLAQLSEVETYSFYGIDREMMDILSCIDEDPAGSSSSSLARRFGYNETYFSHMVRRKAGVRLRELIVVARLRRARALLGEGELSVRGVARAVGYASYSHFNRIFRNAYAITPAAYRAYAVAAHAG